MAESQQVLRSPEYAAAFKSVRAVKNLLLALVALAILVQLASYGLVVFGKILDPIRPELVDKAAVVESGKAPTEKEVENAHLWQNILHWLMRAAKFLAMVSGLLLALTLLAGVQVSLIGRLGGVAGFITAFFWSLILLAMLTPWQQVLQASVACGALSNLGDLIDGLKTSCSEWGAPGTGVKETLLFHSRYVAYPCIALLVWGSVQWKFARGYRAMTESLAGDEEQPEAE